jgi:hypothetical protein
MQATLFYVGGGATSALKEVIINHTKAAKEMGLKIDLQNQSTWK